MSLTSVYRIDRKLSESVAAQVAALQVAYDARFPADHITDCCALFLDAVVPAEPGSSIRVHRFRPARALELARRCLEETAAKGGDLATTAAGSLFVLAKRGEGNS